MVLIHKMMEIFPYFLQLLLLVVVQEGLAYHLEVATQVYQVEGMVVQAVEPQTLTMIASPEVQEIHRQHLHHRVMMVGIEMA